MARKGVVYLSNTHSTVQDVAPTQTIPKAWKFKWDTKQGFIKKMEKSIFVLFPPFLLILLHIYIKATLSDFLS